MSLTGPKSSCWKGWFSLEVLEESFFPCLLRRLELPAFLGLRPLLRLHCGQCSVPSGSASHLVCGHMAVSLQLPLPPSNRILVIALGPLDNPG